MPKLIVELTNRCNLRCRHCILEPGNVGRDLPVRLLDRLLHGARLEKFESIAFTGGEPALHPHFETVLALAVNCGWRFGFVTNGHDFVSLVDSLERYRDCLEVITFSLDGSTASNHDWLRGSGSYRVVMQALSVCVARRFPFTLNTVITRHNYDDLAAIATVAQQLGSRGVRFAQLLPGRYADVCNLKLSNLECRRVCQTVRTLGETIGIPVALAPGCYTEDLFPCAPLRSEEVTVDCWGNLRWCCQLSAGNGTRQAAGVIGNLNDAPFSELLRRLASVLERFRKDKLDRARAGLLHQHDLFPCHYCSVYLNKADSSYAHAPLDTQASS